MISPMETLTAPPKSAPRPRLPEWLRLSLPTSSAFTKTRELLNDLKLHTVCESAKCPNHWECWSKGTATFMIAGDRCTRACGFCAVSTAKPLALEADEPQRVASMVWRKCSAPPSARSSRATAVMTTCLRPMRFVASATRAANPGIVIEVLVPDFLDKDDCIETVLGANPEIYNHNLETVRRLTPSVRHRATYDRSLSVLAKVKARRPDVFTKSGIMLGLGETEAEVITAMEDLRAANCDILTLGQYLQPTLKHLPVVEFVHPDKFAELGARAEALGFVHVASGPMVRSSYHAEEFAPA